MVMLITVTPRSTHRNRLQKHTCNVCDLLKMWSFYPQSATLHAGCGFS